MVTNSFTVVNSESSISFGTQTLILHKVTSNRNGTRSRCFTLGLDNQIPVPSRDGPSTHLRTLWKLKRLHWWLLVVLNIFFLLVGQAAAVLLGRFYYDKGLSAPSSVLVLCSIYFVVGVLIAGDNMLYSIGLLYLSASTYSLICATQLAFNAVFSFFINRQKFTPLILNAVVILSFSASLLAVNEDSDKPSGVSNRKYVIGILTALAASALYSLLLSLMQITFEKVLKKETFSVVLEMQIYTAFVATCVTIVGLFASGEWRTIQGEMDSFTTGKVSYIMTLVWTAVAWQVCSVGVVGLVFVVSSLFSNVISTLSLAVTPIASLIVFHDNMNGVKIIAMLIAFWGFASYIYQNYLDDLKVTKNQTANIDAANDPHC
ncbi:UNVERIFIED_CONTAM: putative purine permease 11 [Sesamum radiatum]|uniref:Probable purine permease n=1 Tax=Sesamum radiatum TaxID=300843 RepID=A0AAW2R2W8_SESRA